MPTTIRIPIPILKEKPILILIPIPIPILINSFSVEWPHRYHNLFSGGFCQGHSVSTLCCVIRRLCTCAPSSCVEMVPDSDSEDEHLMPLILLRRRTRRQKRGRLLVHEILQRTDELEEFRRCGAWALLLGFFSTSIISLSSILAAQTRL